MIDPNSLTGFYLELNLLLVFAWLINLLLTRFQSLINWNASSRSRLKTARIVFLFIFIVPLFYRLLPPVAVPDISDDLQKPVQVIQVTVSGWLQDKDEKNITEQETRNMDAWGTVYLILVTGFVALSARLLYRLSNLYSLLKNSYRYKAIGKLEILVSEDVSVPFSTRLFFKSQIVIPEYIFTEFDFLQIIIAHEGQHLRNRDTGFEIVLEIIRILFFWNPAVYLWSADLSVLQEYACDEAVIQHRKVSGYDYGQCLYYITERFNTSNFNPVASSCMAGRFFLKRFSATQLERRLIMLKKVGDTSITSLKIYLLRLAGCFGMFVMGLVAVACTGSISGQHSLPASSTNEADLIRYDARIIEFTPDTEFKEKVNWATFRKSLDIPVDPVAWDFEDYMQALNNRGSATLMSTPKLITKNRTPAAIRVGTDMDDTVNKPVFAGINLEFVPEIIDGSRIRQDIELSCIFREAISVSNNSSGFITNMESQGKVELESAAGEIVVLAAGIEQGTGEGREDGRSRGIVILLKADINEPVNINAGNVVLDVKVSYSKPSGRYQGEIEAIDISSINTLVMVNQDETLSIPELIPFPGGGEETVKSSGAIELPYRVEIKPAIVRQDEILLAVRIFESTGEKFDLIAEPESVTGNNLMKSFEITSDSGAIYTIDIRPSIKHI